MKKEELLKFYQTYKLYIFPSVVGGACLILIVFVIFPQIVSLVSGGQAETQLLAKSNFLEAKAEKLESEDLEQLQKRVAFAVNIYPTEKDLISSVGVLQNLIKRLGFEINNLSIGSSAKTGASESFDIGVDLVGPASLLPILLSNIENSSKLMRVASLESSSSRDSSKTTISLTINVLYSNAPTTYGSTDSVLPELSEKDKDVITKLAKNFPAQTTGGAAGSVSGSKGKSNPFE